MLKWLMAGAVIGLLAMAGGDAHAVEKVTIGNAKTVVKTVIGTLEADRRNIKLLDDIYHNELIETGDESATEFIFLDETKLALGPNSSLVLDRFIYDPDPDKASFVMTATAGVFRFVSGKLPKKSYEIHTPTATIGIRGTAFTVVVLPAGPDGAVAKVNITVERGVAEITNCRGERVFLDGSAPSTTITGSGNGTCSAPTMPGPQPSEFAALVGDWNLLKQ
jgi:hypothetical protein